jgi:alpha-tubulin suppressor-like RCC1 family protein
VKQFCNGALHACGVLENGTVECAGWGERGQLGTGDHLFDTLGRPVVGLTRAVQVTCGAAHTCALLETGDVRCWGAAESGQLGIGFVYTNYPAGISWPVAVPP